MEGSISDSRETLRCYGANAKRAGDKVITVHVDSLYRGDATPEGWVTGQRMSEGNTQGLPTSDSHSYNDSEVSPAADFFFLFFLIVSQRRISIWLENPQKCQQSVI